MWILYAVGSAFFAGITAILAKCGIKKTESNLATAIRTSVVIIFAWLIVFVSGAYRQLSHITIKTYLFLALSGFSTGASWLFYFKALQCGSINKVVSVDKSSAVLAMIFAFVLLGEKPTPFKIFGVVVVSAGILFMSISRNISEENQGKKWAWYSIFSAVFAALTSVFGKIGIDGVDSNLGTALRTIVVLMMAWFIVGIQYTSKRQQIRVPKKELGFLILSGIATGASWLCYYRALQDGMASVVVAIDKLSIVITVLFSYIVFKERLTGRSAFGLILMVTGTVLMLF